MRFSWILIILLLGSRCAGTVGVEDLHFLKGYWEIEKVVFPNGQSKQYEISTTIDYFEYREFKGYRKKVQPNLDGTFSTSDDAVNFKIENKNNIFILRYQNELSTWEEEIKVLKDTRMVLVNEEGLAYHYKRFNPISVN